MGFKSLFNRKKKRISLTNSVQEHPTPVASRVSSLNTRAQIEEEMEQVFKKFDVNGDGKISASELGAMITSLGGETSDEEIERMIKEVDADGDGFIDLNEFLALNKDVDSDEVMENLKEAFSVFDMDKNGSISADELQKVLESLGEESSIAECRRMISGVDSDGDGMISFDEFKVMMMVGSRFDAIGSKRHDVYDTNNDVKIE